MNIIQSLEKGYLKEGIPSFRVGDTIRVHAKVVEGTRKGSRSTRRGHRPAGRRRRELIRVRKLSYGVGVERLFPLHSPMIDKIELAKQGKVRRAKLYFLRDLRGKAPASRKKSACTHRLPAQRSRKRRRNRNKSALRSTILEILNGRARTTTACLGFCI